MFQASAFLCDHQRGVTKVEVIIINKSLMEGGETGFITRIIRLNTAPCACLPYRSKDVALRCKPGPPA